MSSPSPLISSFVAGMIGAAVVLGFFFAWTHHHPLAATSAGTTALTNVPSSSEEALTVNAVKKANPAVVSIVISKDIPMYQQQSNPFNDFFGNNFFDPFGSLPSPPPQQQGTQRQEIGGGSGFLVSSDGLIVTNKHVVSDTTADYTVFTNDGQQHTAKVVARDPSNDVAIIKIDGTGYPSLQFGSSDQLRIGQTVLAIGNPLGEFQNTVSKGIVSGLSRSITAGDLTGTSEELTNVIQTDAAINPGNSGGPLVDLNGNVVGVNVATVIGSQNIGFALPSKLVQSVAESVQKTGHIVRPYIGVRYQPITPALQQQMSLPVNYGALVTHGQNPGDAGVIPGSPADAAGIKEGDIILEVDGTKLDDTHNLGALISQKSVGDHVQLKIWHQGATRDATLTLAEIPQ